MSETETKRNGEVKLEEILKNIDEMTASYGVSKLQWPVYDDMFKYFDTSDVIRASEVLKNTEIMLVRRLPTTNSTEEIKNILEKYHDEELYGGHCGQKRLYAKLRTLFYWPKMARDIARYIKKTVTSAS